MVLCSADIRLQRTSDDPEYASRSLQHKSISYPKISTIFNKMSPKESVDYNEDDGPLLPFRKEIERGDLHAVLEALVDGRLDPNACDSSYDERLFFSGSYTILQWAVRHTRECEIPEGSLPAHATHRIQIVRALLDLGAKANVVFWNEFDAERVLDWADHPMVRRWLLEASVQEALGITDKKNPDNYPEIQLGLLSAAELGQTDVCLTFCNDFNYCDVNDNTYNVSALGAASCNGHLETVRLLIEKLGAKVDLDIEENGKTALWWAAEHGKLDVVRFLLEKGADPMREIGCMGGVCAWACSKCAFTSELILEIRTCIIESCLSASVDRVKNTDPSRCVFQWVVLECIRHGYIAGLEVLKQCQNSLQFPTTALQLALVCGQYKTLLHLAENGALKTYDKNSKKQIWYGPSHFMPSKEIIVLCQELLNILLEIDEAEGVQAVPSQCDFLFCDFVTSN